MSDVPPKQPVRKPGSQVAPNQKPFFRPGGTASTHSRVPIDQATAGKLYRVRDKADGEGNAIVWGEGLTHTEAQKLKEQVVTQRRSKTARLEEMLPEEIQDLVDGSAPFTGPAAVQFAAPPVEPTTTPRPPSVVPYSDVRPEMVVQRQHAGLTLEPDYTKLAGGDLFRELGDDAQKWATAFCQHATDRGIRLSRDDESWALTWFASAIESRPRPVSATSAASDASNDYLAEVRKKALAAARPVAVQAQARHNAKPKVAIVSDPPKPPPSPLSDELLELEDGQGELPPDEIDTPADISDLSAEVGGGPSDADKQRAREQAAKDVADTTAQAKAAYDAATKTDADGPWPSWEALGEFEHAAWRYFVTQGGTPPELVKTPRKPVHAMGSVP